MDNHIKATVILGAVLNEHGETVAPPAYNVIYINLDDVLDYYDITSAYYDVQELEGYYITRITYLNGISRDVIYNIDDFNAILMKYKNSLNKWLVRKNLN